MVSRKTVRAVILSLVLVIFFGVVAGGARADEPCVNMAMVVLPDGTVVKGLIEECSELWNGYPQYGVSNFVSVKIKGRWYYVFGSNFAMWYEPR